MDSTEIYSLVVGSIALLLIFCRLFGVISSYLYTYSRYFFLSHLVYARLYRRVSRLRTIPRYHLLIQFTYFCGTALCNFIGVQSISQVGSRASRIAAVNLIPLLFSSGHGFGAHLLGISLWAYESIHSTVSLMVLIQSIIHTVIALQSVRFSFMHDLHRYGVLCASMILLLFILPLFRRHHYELFLVSHLGFVVALVYTLWRHVRTFAKRSSRYVLVSIVLLGVTTTLRLARGALRNLTYRRSFARVNTVFEGDPKTTARVFQVTITPPRPWKVKAGEWLNLGVPYVGFSHMFQSHPFMVVWTEEDRAGYATTICLLAKPRSGFTRRLLGRVNQQRKYLAWIDGPYGPPTISERGQPARIGSSGHVVLLATGIGISAHIPYIREALREKKECRALTRRISLVWEPDDIDDLDMVRNWLQTLVNEDTDYTLTLMIYDTSRSPSASDPVPFSEHNRILIYGGKVNWTYWLQREIERKEGTLLVMVSMRSDLREKVYELVRKNVPRDVKLQELEFQPWVERQRWCFI